MFETSQNQKHLKWEMTKHESADRREVRPISRLYVSTEMLIIN